MTDTINKDENTKMEEPVQSPPETSPNGEEKQGSGHVESTEYGFDPTGQYFVLRVPVKAGHIFILGFLEKAKDFIKMHTARQMAESQKKSLIKPPVGKGFGRFNLFKR